MISIRENDSGIVLKGFEPEMNGILVINLQHYLNKKGAIPETLPKPALKIARQMAEIVADVTRNSSGEDATIETGINCNRRPKRKKCKGLLIAIIEEQNEIHWSCPVCEDSGIIRGWAGSFWDLRGKST
ncbi:hypothetical protein ACFL35_21820 [Candidatus Riflebacteria bacterium]